MSIRAIIGIKLLASSDRINRLLSSLSLFMILKNTRLKAVVSFLCHWSTRCWNNISCDGHRLDSECIPEGLPPHAGSKLEVTQQYGFMSISHKILCMCIELTRLSVWSHVACWVRCHQCSKALLSCNVIWDEALCFEVWYNQLCLPACLNCTTSMYKTFHIRVFFHAGHTSDRLLVCRHWCLMATSWASCQGLWAFSAAWGCYPSATTS